MFVKIKISKKELKNLFKEIFLEIQQKYKVKITHRKKKDEICVRKDKRVYPSEFT